MMKHAIAFTAAGALALMGAYAVAKPGDGAARPTKMSMMDEKMEAHFLAMDANQDGLVSEQEMIDFVTAKAKAEFAKSAGDDHMLSPEEFKAMHKAKHQQMMEEREKMMDGAASDDEGSGDQEEMDHSKMEH